jgi:hypothetical protein
MKLKPHKSNNGNTEAFTVVWKRCERCWRPATSLGLCGMHYASESHKAARMIEIACRGPKINKLAPFLAEIIAMRKTETPYDKPMPYGEIAAILKRRHEVDTTGPDVRKYYLNNR